MAKINVVKKGSRWVAEFAFDWTVKDIVKDAGFRFDPATKSWWTSDPVIAARLDPNAAAQAEKAIADSRAASADIDVPAPAGLSYLPYQLAGIKYALGRPATLIGDEMGLGKTIQAVGVINADSSINSVLVVCPASLKINWSRELKKWLTRGLSVAIANGGNFPDADVVVINYEILEKHRKAIDALHLDLLIVDEAHYVKNDKAARTRALLGRRDRRKGINEPGIKARRRLFLTGTPIVNRPAELWTLVEALDPDGLGRNRFAFMQRYTDAQHNGYGWDFSGASNLPELQQRLRAKVMVRRLKADVLTELPAKRRQVVVLEPPSAVKATIAEEKAKGAKHKAKLLEALQAIDDAKAKGDKEAFRNAVKEMHAARRVAFTEMSKARHRLAVTKIPQVIEHVKEILEAEEKVVVFTHHLDVVNGLREAFPNAAVVTGEANMEARQAAVDAFTGDPNVRVFLGTYPGAAGVGLTLTSARVAVFAELDWVPGNVSQAEDRLHRIGQKNAVLIQHLVYDGSLDADMAQTIIDKQDVITVATDQPAELDNGDHAAFIKALPEPKQGSEPNKVSGWNEPLPTSVPF